MADFGEIINKFIAILLSLFQALSPDAISQNVKSVGSSFESFGEVVQITTPVSSVLDIIDINPKFPPTIRKDPQDVCSSVVCKDYADFARASMRITADPCDDFYEFACGGFLRHAIVTAVEGDSDNQDQVTTGNHTGVHSVAAQLRNRTQHQIREVLESTETEISGSRTKARQLYSACINLDQSDKTGSTALLSLLDTVIGGWPLITASNWNASKFDLYKALAAIKNHGFDGIFQWQVVENLPKDPTGNVIQLGQAVLGLESADAYLQDENGSLRQVYKDFIANIAGLLAGNNTTEQRMLDVRDLVDFERKLANATLNYNNSSGSPIALTIGAFTKQYLKSSRLSGQLLPLLKNVFRSVDLDGQVTSATFINVQNPGFFLALDSLLASVDRLGDDGKMLLANYIGWNIIFTQLPLLSPDYRKALRQFAVAAGSTIEDSLQPRGQECSEFVNTMLPNAVGSLYVSKFVDPAVKPKVKEIISGIKDVARSFVSQCTWMDKAAKSVATEKIDALVDYVGYPDYIVDSIPQLDHLYDEVSVSDSHFENVQNLSRFALLQQLRKLAKTNDRMVDDEAVPVNVNVYYYYDRNLIAIFAGVLQSPVFDLHLPDYVNYAGIGYLYAHKLAEIFGENGSQLNATGSPISSWWSPAVTTAYRSRMNNLRNQYRSFAIPEGQLRGGFDSSDLFADELAFQLTMTAYGARRQQGQELSLPKLEQFTPDMDFFLAFGQNWCENYVASAADPTTGNLLNYPKRLRIDIPLTNSVEFNDVYNCSSEAKMNPKRKTSLS